MRKTRPPFRYLRCFLSLYETGKGRSLTDGGHTQPEGVLEPTLPPYLAVGYAHNVVELLHWRTGRVVRRSICAQHCMLYAHAALAVGVETCDREAYDR